MSIRGMMEYLFIFLIFATRRDVFAQQVTAEEDFPICRGAGCPASIWETIVTSQTLVVESTIIEEGIKSQPRDTALLTGVEIIGVFGNLSSATIVATITSSPSRPTSSASGIISNPSPGQTSTGANSAATLATNPPAIPSSGLSTGAKAGLGAGLAIGAVIIIVAVILWRRRRNRKEQRLRVLGNEDYDGTEKIEPEAVRSRPSLMLKPELPGTEGHTGSSFKLSPKPELAAESEAKDAGISAAVVEMEHFKPTQPMPELESVERNQHYFPNGDIPRSHEKDREELQQSPKAAAQTIKRKDISSPVSGPLSPQSEPSPSLAGPLPSASELYPTPQPKEAVAVEEAETDFAYQERRLRERRAMIAERKRLAEEEEQIAMEEEALRRKKAAKGARG